MSEIQPVLKEFMWAMERTLGEQVRGSGDNSVIKDQCTGGREGDQEFREERDNDIFNMGVAAGITGFADHLHEAGYVITDKDGTVVKTEQQIGDEPALTFSQTYFTTAWSNVNT